MMRTFDQSLSRPSLLNSNLLHGQHDNREETSSEKAGSETSLESLENTEIQNMDPDDEIRADTSDDALTAFDDILDRISNVGSEDSTEQDDVNSGDEEIMTEKPKVPSVTFAPGTPVSSKSSTSISHLTIDEIRQRMGTTANNLYVSEMLDELSRLRILLSDTKIDKSAMKAMKRKKDKQIVKVAKQLALNVNLLKERNAQIEKNATIQKDLETKISKLQKDLTDVTSHSESLSRTHHTEMTSYQDQIRENQRKSDELIVELNTNHTKQCETLRQQVMAISLEADQLRLKLARYEMKERPNGAAKIAKRTMDDSARISAVVRKDKGPRGIVYSIVRSLTIFLLGSILSFVLFVGLFKTKIPPTVMSSICAPTPPGTILSEALPRTIDLRAPWWIPSFAKPMVFGLLCDVKNEKNESRLRTQIEWKGSKDKKLLVVSQLPTRKYVKNKESRAVLIKKSAKSVIIHADTIELFIDRKKGTSIILDAPWKL